MQIKKLNGLSNAIGKNIKKYRELRLLTQRELSDKISLLGIDIYHSDISFQHKNNIWIMAKIKHTYIRKMPKVKQNIDKVFYMC